MLVAHFRWPFFLSLSHLAAWFFSNKIEKETQEMKSIPAGAEKGEGANEAENGECSYTKPERNFMYPKKVNKKASKWNW